jgi:hypothetical protein
MGIIVVRPEFPLSARPGMGGSIPIAAISGDRHAVPLSPRKAPRHAGIFGLTQCDLGVLCLELMRGRRKWLVGLSGVWFLY